MKVPVERYVVIVMVSFLLGFGLAVSMTADAYEGRIPFRHRLYLEGRRVLPHRSHPEGAMNHA